jgi:hypothetical protein
MKQLTLGSKGISLCLLTLIFMCTNVNAQTYNLTPSGNMENLGWTGIPGTSNLTTTFEASTGIDNTKSLKLVASSLGANGYYIVRCEDQFHLNSGDKITVSFWAKGSVSGMRLQPWVQESDANQWMNMGDAYVSTSWVQYRFTVTITTQTSDHYKLKFRGYNNGTVWVDNVQIGPVDYNNVAQSGIYSVNLTQNSKTWPLNVFKNACPTYQLGYQNMDAKDEHPLTLFAGRTVNWTKFSFTGSMTVKVTVDDTQKVPVSGQTVRILPSRYGITSTTSGNVITFTITQPGQYSVEIGTEYYKNALFIFADPVETSIPSQTDPNYKVLYNATAADVASIPSNYTGVYFRRGVHNIDSFNIPTNIKNVYFEDGSWVYGSLKMEGNSGVKIFGRGVLSSANFNYRAVHCVNAENGSNNITIEGLVVADPKYYGVRLVGTDNNVSYTKIIGGWVYNCDGISVFDRSHVSKSFIWANDDAIKIYRDSTTFSDIVCWQLNNGGIIQMSWGGAVGGSTAKGCTISRLDILRAEWDVARFNVGLLNCVGNHYHDVGRYALQQDWLIEDVKTQRPIPLIFNVTPDGYTHNHIHGLTLKNWDVEMTTGTSFKNAIMGEDPNDFFSGFVFDNVVYNSSLMTNINYMTTGDMDAGGWVAVPKNTDQVVTLGSTYGTNGWGLRSVVTTMGTSTDYNIKANENFHLNNGQQVTISFWAKATADGKRLVPFVQETATSQWMNVGDFNLTTAWKWYTCTATLSQVTSDFYQVKFRGYATAWIFLDKVQVGPPDWRTLLNIDIQYLNTPTFLPNTPPVTRKTFSLTPEQKPNAVSVINGANPVGDIISLSPAYQNGEYRIYDFAGRLRMSGRGKEINVSHLNAGVYILVVGKERMQFIKK